MSTHCLTNNFPCFKPYVLWCCNLQNDALVSYSFKPSLERLGLMDCGRRNDTLLDLNRYIAYFSTCFGFLQSTFFGFLFFCFLLIVCALHYYLPKVSLSLSPIFRSWVLYQVQQQQGSNFT